MSRQPPTQELVAKDLHGNEWRFRHIFRGNGSFILLIHVFCSDFFGCACISIRTNIGNTSLMVITCNYLFQFMLTCNLVLLD